MADLFLSDISVLLPDGAVADHQDVSVESGRFQSIRPHQGPDGAVHGRVISGCGKLLMPPLADCHMHTGQQLLKGRILDELPMIWTRIMLPFESTLTPERMTLSAGLAALEMIASGTGAFIGAGSYHMEAAAQVYLRSGLRGILSASTMDQPGLPPSIAQNAEEAIAQTDRLYDGYHGNGLLKVAYSLRSLISCSPRLIEMAGARAQERGTLLQAHMNEYPNEVNFYLQHYGCRPAEYLAGRGLLGPHFLGAHGILLSASEKALLAQSGSRLCHCPFSNCGKGAPDAPGLLGLGVTVGLGTDGAAHGGLSLWNEMKIFRSVMNVTWGVSTSDPAIMPAARVLSMATKNGYAIMGLPQGGQIQEGAPADFITIRMDAPHLFPTGDPVNTLLECVTAGDVTDLAVDGKLLMKDRQILTLDQEKILYEARKYQDSLDLHPNRPQTSQQRPQQKPKQKTQQRPQQKPQQKPQAAGSGERTARP